MNKTTKITTFLAKLYGQVLYFSTIYSSLKDRAASLFHICQQIWGDCRDQIDVEKKLH